MALNESSSGGVTAAVLKVGLAILSLGMLGYILGPPLYWHLAASLLEASSSSSCSACICDCSTEPHLSISLEGLGNTSIAGQVTGDELWKHATIIRRPSEGGGNLRWRCNFCQKEYTGSLTRLKDHLLKIKSRGIAICAKISPLQLREVQQFVDESALRAESSRPRSVPLPPSVGSTSHPHMGSSSGVGLSVEQRKRRATNPIEKAFNTSERQELDALIARAFYSAALPFNLARNPYFQDAFTYATNKAKSISGYKIPGYNALRTTLLQNEKANIERLLEPTKYTWVTKGATIVCDGWTDSQRRPLINFIVINEGGPMFLKAVNCEGEYKDKLFIAGLIKEVVHEVGPRNVVQVITDNAPVCKAAGLLVENQYPEVFWTPCVVHTLNLALKNICAPKNTPANEKAYSLCSWIIDVVGDGVMIKNFIMNHSMRLHMFNEHSRLKLLSIAETRFASSLIMLKRFKDIKSSIQSMVIGDKWDSYREDDVEKARIVKGKLLDDLWWDKVDYIIHFTEPIYSMLRRADTDKACLHLVYEMWDVMIEKVKQAIYRHEGKENSEESEFFSVVHQILVDRWETNNTPLHCLAHSLNPRYYSREWLEEDTNRIAPHLDHEITKGREKCFQRYFPNIEERRLVVTEYARFSTGSGLFAQGDALHNRAYLEPDVWWVSYGNSAAPLLLRMALKLLGQPCSSSCCERNWSTYNNIQSLKRNKLTPQRAEDLVYVHSNLRLLSRKKQEYKEGETRMWDIAGDTIDSLNLDAAAGMLEIANLSLDEPELEAGLLNEENAIIDPPPPVNEEEEM